MALVEQAEFVELLAIAQEKIIDYIENERYVYVHCHGNDGTVRHTVLIDEFELSDKGFYLVSGTFQLNIESDLTAIQYIKEEDSLYIKFLSGKEIYLNEK